MGQADIVLDIVKIAGAAAAFLISLAQYSKAQRWKRAEFVANEVKEFGALPEVRNAKLMLDYTDRYVDLYPEKEAPEERRVRVTDSVLVAALEPHLQRKAPTRFTQDEARMRDTIDEFFGRLERFENFIAAGLISKDECAPYLSYWLEIIGRRDRDARRRKLARALQTYIKTYDYDGVENLLIRFGYEVKAESRGREAPNKTTPEEEPSEEVDAERDERVKEAANG